MTEFCSCCKEDFEPTPHQIKKCDWLCPHCRRLREKEYRAKRKASGNPVSSTKMPRGWHEKYEDGYYKKPDVRAKRAIAAKQRRLNPHERSKILARDLTNKAIKSGKIKKKPCEKCGDKKSEAHHDDYYKPLNVRWLCRKHHIEHHAKATGEA